MVCSKRFNLNGFIKFKQFGSIFIMNKWFALFWFQGQETEPGPLLVVDDIVSFSIRFQCAAQRNGNSCASWCEACSCWIDVINLDGTFDKPCREVSFLRLLHVLIGCYVSISSL